MATFDDSMGALLVGQMVATFLYGLSTLQTYVYFTKFPRDKRELKIWVGLTWIIDTVNIALVCHGLYTLLFGHAMPNKDNPITDRGKRSFDISAGLNVLVAILVQCFFVKRIFQLCDQQMKYWVLAVLSVLVLTHFALGSAAVVRVIEALSVSEAKPLNTLSLSAIVPYTLAAVVSDTAISIALVLLLRTKRSGFESLNSILDRAINFALTRCVLVSIVAIARLITFVVVPQTLWFLAADFGMGKIYANSLLAMLNARRAQPTYTVEQGSGSSGETAVFSTVLELSSPRADSPTTSRFLPTFSLRRVSSMRDFERQDGSDKVANDSNAHYIPTLPVSSST